MFEKFRSVIFAVSIDGIGAKNDYLRHGSEFDKVIANLTQYHNDLKSMKHVQLYVRCTPTPLNVHGIDEYCEYFDKTGIRYTINNYAVDEPHNNIQYMPESIKQKVADKLQNVKHPQVDQLIRYMMGTPADLEQKQLSFWKHNTKLDQIRKQSFADVFPDWHAVWQEYLAE
jgi:sulfatase maturation enzyme AslB (radical SAM superfamily)